MTEVLKAGVLSDEIDLGALAHNAAEQAEEFVRKVSIAMHEWSATFERAAIRSADRMLCAFSICSCTATPNPFSSAGMGSLVESVPLSPSAQVAARQ